MNFYLSAVDDLLRHADDKPSIGIILCKAKNQIVAEYALRDLAKPVGAKPGGSRTPREVLRGASTRHESSPHLLGLLDGCDTEKPLELPAELRRALVADCPGGRARVVAIVGHEPPGRSSRIRFRYWSGELVVTSLK